MRSLLFFPLLLFSLSLSAQVCLEGNCENGKGRLRLADGSVYDGEFKDGRFTGKGRHSMPDGTVYTGEFK